MMNGHRNIVSASSELSYLQQRLRYANSHCERPLIFAENVPQCADDAERFLAVANEVRNYHESVGQPALLHRLQRREERKYGRSPEADRLLLTHGASGGLALALGWLRSSHRRFLGHAPMLKSIAQIAATSGYLVELESDLGRLLERLAAPGAPPTAVYFCSPSNPAGKLITPAQWRELSAIAMRAGHTLLVDQVYDDFIYAGEACSPLTVDCDPDRYFCFNSFSKNYAAPGLRVGWMIGAVPTINALTSTWERLGICLAGPSQVIALALLDRDNRSLVTAAAERREQVARWLLAHCEHPTVPDAGLQAVLPVPQGEAEPFADQLLATTGLVLTTSANYAGCRQDFIRIPFGYPRSVTTAALELIAAALASSFHRGAKAVAPALQS